MIDFIADYGSSLFGLILTVFTAYYDYRQSNGSYRWLNWRIITILILGICIFGSSVINNVSSKNEKGTLNEKLDSLRQGIRVASGKIQNMKISQDDFEKVLLEKFKIVRDTTSNLPKRLNTYNTTIGTAGTVNIGRD